MEDKVIAVTGASGGLGECVARHLANKGATLVLGARNISRLETIRQEIVSKGGKAFCIKTDVTIHDDVNELIQYALACTGRLDVLVNNAGIMRVAPLDALKIDEWNRMIDTNIKGVLYGVASALPVFERQGYGHFINIASVAGLKVASPGSTVYSATKFAVRAISDGLRHEVKDGIRVTVISPGAFDSKLKEGNSHEESSKRILDFYKKISIDPQPIADAIYFAIKMPQEVDVNEIVVRPTKQEF